MPADDARFRVLLRLEVSPGTEAEFERTWLGIGERIAEHPANLEQWLVRSGEEPGVYYVISDWVDEAQFRAFEHSDEHTAHRAALRPYRVGGSMTTGEVRYRLAGASVSEPL